MVERGEQINRKGGLATTALVLGIVAAVFGWTGPFGLVLAILAIVFAIIALVKKQSKVKSIWGLVLGAVALITALIVISVANAVVDVLEKNSTPVATESSESTTPDAFTVGQAIDFDNKKVTVTSVERNWNSGNQYVTPETGNEFVKVEVSIENNSNSQVSYNTFDWKMQDGSGVIKDIDPNTFMVDGSLDSGQLAPNGKVTGFMVFQVPADDTNLVLSYNPSFFSDKKVEIKL